MDLDVTMCDELLGTTRAVRKRLDLTKEVPREIILDCLQIATQAPTGSNAQGWRWIVIEEAETRQQLADLYRQAGEGYLTTSLKQTPPGQSKRVFDSAVYLMENLHLVPMHIIPCITGTPPPGIFAGGFYASIYPAVWNFQLALRARGLGSCLTTLHLAFAAEAAKLLRIPEGITQAALLPVAWTLGTQFKRAARPSVASITHWNRWSDA